MTDCPALIDLTASELGPELSQHLRMCRRCRALRKALPGHETSFAVQPESSTRELQRRPSTGDFGLVTTFEAALNLVVYVAAVRNGEAVVIPISDHTSLATEWDLLIDESLLGYPAMAQTWNSGVVLVEQLDEAIVTASPTLRSKLHELLEATEKGVLPNDLPIGVPVLGDEDPRLLFQEAEAELARAFWEPRMMLAGAATIGELVAQRKEELELTAEELQRLFDDPTELAELEANRLNLVGHQEVLVSLFHALRLKRSQKLADLLRQSVHQSWRLTQVAAKSREMRSIASGPGTDAHQEAIRDAEIDAFVSRVMSHLPDWG